MTIQVTYPSGQTFTISGRWQGPQRVLRGSNSLGTDADFIAVEQEDGSILALDPRGTYTDVLTGRTLYRGIHA